MVPLTIPGSWPWPSDDGDMELGAEGIVELVDAAIASHERMWVSAGCMTDEECHAPSLLPTWSRAHVLAHWARNADGQTRMLTAAMRGEIAAQYPGGDVQRSADIAAGAARPGWVILQDVRAALDRIEDVWRRMPAEVWRRPTDARMGRRAAWQSVWARWRETEIHHVDLASGYTHRNWPRVFVQLMLPRVLLTMDARLVDEIAVRVETNDGGWTRSWAGAGASGDDVLVRGTASAVLCWLLGRPTPVGDALGASVSGRPCPLPGLRPWA